VAVSGAAPPILVHGHRGARGVLPENTIPSFVHAIEAGAAYIELDLAVTQDDVLVVSHDPIINERICKGPEKARPIRQMSLAEVKQWDCGAIADPSFPKQKPLPGTRIPTLDEVLELSSRGGFRFNIEIKSDPSKPEYAPAPEEFARLVLEAVRRHKLEDRVMVQSFDFRVTRAMKQLAPDMPLAALFSRGSDFVGEAREAHASMVSPHYSQVTPERVKAAQTAGLPVTPWTANDDRVWDRLIAAGVDGIITDYPAELIAYLKAKGLQ
jgi:glycerophosphoryl diester phosphodiesterase